ncbi:MAG: hypothetical protein LBB38_02705 [Puniceicoccales bacterium]|nr:hypothetical protein [Puniceicoccales bacterium]
MALIDDAMARQRGRPPGSSKTFFPRRNLLLRSGLITVIIICAAAAALWRRATPVGPLHGKVLSIFSRNGGGGTEKCETAPQLHGSIDDFSIRGVQIGRYETRAIIDGKLLRQGEKIKCNLGELLFRGTDGKNLLFEDGNGVIYRRRFMPDADGDN